MRFGKRKLYAGIWQKLLRQKAMIFLIGPRQVGKTTFAKILGKNLANQIYLNWDSLSDKRKITENPTFFTEIPRVDFSKPLVILDEIHKKAKWKDYLKGIYDEFAPEFKFLVLGSGRLDLFQQGGDSLAGRYFLLYLFPFTISELTTKSRSLTAFRKNPLINFALNSPSVSQRIWERLFQLSGFPEPYLKNKVSFWRIWTQNYTRQILYEDLRDFANIKKADALATLFALLPSKIGSPLSINSLATTLQISFDTAAAWLRLFKLVYLTFEISPWHKRLTRVLKKEKKVYLFNYPLIEKVGARFENMVALELQRAVQTWNVQGFGNFGLHYIRTKDGQEVDFLLTENNQPLLLLEAKYQDQTISPGLLKIQRMLQVPAVQLLQKCPKFSYIQNQENKILIVAASRFLASLPK